jgi:hypothetical protein
MIPSMPKSPKWSVPFMFKFCIFFSSLMFTVSCPSHPPPFAQINSVA